MIEFVDVLIGASIAGVFFAWGGHREKARKPAPYVAPPPPVAMCGCGHHLSYHDPETTACTANDERYRELKKDGTRGGIATCRCRRYVGPEPLPTYV